MPNAILLLMSLCPLIHCFQPSTTKRKQTERERERERFLVHIFSVQTCFWNSWRTRSDVIYAKEKDFFFCFFFFKKKFRFVRNFGFQQPLILYSAKAHTQTRVGRYNKTTFKLLTHYYILPSLSQSSPIPSLFSFVPLYSFSSGPTCFLGNQTEDNRT